MRYSRQIALSWTGLLAGCCVGLFGMAPAASAQNQGQSQRTFDVEAYDVDGAHMLQQVEIETAVYPYLGPGRTAGDIEHAREALQKIYADRGYQSVVVQLPPQSVSDNIVRIHVIEASIGRLRVTGARYFSPEAVKSEMPALKEGETPNLGEAQKELADANRLPDRQVTPTIRPGQLPGTIDVDLNVNDTLPLHGSVELNNDHNQSTEPLRLTGTVSYGNLWQLGHSITFTYAVAPQDRDQSEIFALSYLAPVWGTPWSILVSGYNSNSSVAAIGGVNVLGKGYDISLKALRILPPIGGFTDSVLFGIDAKDTFQGTDIENNGCKPHFEGDINKDQPFPCPQIHYWPASVTYNLDRDGPRFTTKASLGLTWGIPGLGNSNVFHDSLAGQEQGSISLFEAGRHDARPDFVHFNIDLTQTEALPRGFSASQHLTGQMTDQPLLSAEQFSAGGLTSVRGYLQSEGIGDMGFSGSLELRSPSLAPRLGSVFDDLRLYGFVDGAELRTWAPLAGQQELASLASVGLGLHVELLKHLQGEVVGAQPLIFGTVTHTTHPNVTFSLKSDF